MAGLDAVSRLLDRNRELISRELESTKILGLLVKKGVLSVDEEQAVNSHTDANLRCDVFVRVLAQKGLSAFRELCYALEKECPHVLTSLLVDAGSNNAATGEKKQIELPKMSESQVNGGTPGSGSSSSLSLSSGNGVLEESGDDIAEKSNRRDASLPSPPPQQSEMPLNRVSAPVAMEAQVRRGLTARPPSPEHQLASPKHQSASSIPALQEVLEEPVEEMGGERISWEYHTVNLSRVPGYGFGIAVSGGRDNPHFANGDPAIAISDVLKAGPAEGRLQVNDRILSANGVPLENVDYSTAVQVLRDSGHTVQLVVKRRVVLPPTGSNPNVAAAAEPTQTLRVSLARGKKKDDFGLVLGCRLFVKEVGSRCREAGLREGDILLSINALPTENMTLKEAKKLMDSTKERLNLVVRRDPLAQNASNLSSMGATSLSREGLQKTSNSSNNLLMNSSGYSSQNLYVQPPTRGMAGQSSFSDPDKSSNLAPRTTPGRSRGPLMDVSLSQLDRPATPADDGSGPPPRPALPRPEDYYSTRRQLYDEDPLSRNKLPMPDPRYITFQKESSVGIRLTGGNEAGIFVTAVQPGSPASLQGLQPGDKILKVNETDVKGMTREEAVLLLLGLQDQVDLIVQYRREEYDQVVANQRGDSFHIKAHFNYDQPNKGEMCFRKGDVFHVTDTLYNGVVGSWQVYRIGRNNQEVQKGIIPNKARADELAAAQLSASKKELTASESRGSFFRRRRSNHRRSKSLSKDHWDDVVFADSMNKFPAYERVVLRHPGFVRPVVLFGPVVDVAREKLLRDFPDKFTSPQTESTDSEKGGKASSIIRLSAIREMVDRGKHGLLDITPNAVDRLNYAQFYPIVVFLRADNKQVVKDIRAGHSKGVHKSSKKLLEQSQKLEKLWSHIFTGTIGLTAGSDAWYRKLRELLETQQSQPVWISETKPEEALSDDFLFPMTSRLSYASSPESDLELSPEPRSTAAGGAAVPSAGHVLHQHLLAGGAGSTSPTNRLVRSTSDPSIATQEELGSIPNYSGPPPYTLVPPYKQNAENQARTPSSNGTGDVPSKRRSQQPDSSSKYGFAHQNGDDYGTQPVGSGTPGGHHHHFHPPAGSHQHHPPSSHHHHSHPPSFRSPLAHSPPPTRRQASEAPVGSSASEFPQPPHRQSEPPELPPRVDRTNKPPGNQRTPGSRSAQERLFGDTGDANYMNAGVPGQHLRGNSSLERGQHPSNLKTQSSYDSVSSYDSFNRIGSNAHDDLKSSNNGETTPTSPRSHDPYRFTRSTAQPVKAERSPMTKGPGPEYPNKFRSEYKPSPPPKGGLPGSPSSHPTSYKPVPPPKPKNYRPPTMQQNGDANGSDLYWRREEQVSHTNNTSSGFYHARSFSVGEAITNGQGTQINGRGDEDSGHGSSLDRNYNHQQQQYQQYHATPPHSHHNSPSKSRGGGGGSQYYYNVPAAVSNGSRLTNGHHRSDPSSGLDLANREQRGSAFELYRKPADPRTPPAYIEHGMRSGLVEVAAAKSVIGAEGGTLSDAGVSLHVPPGALPAGCRKEIFFRVCRSDDPNILPPLDKGEELLSPLVMCGPLGLKFLKPVELSVPVSVLMQDGDEDDEEPWNLSLRSGEVDAALQPQWSPNLQMTSVPRRKGCLISVLVDHF
ncbi:tight junction protein ZO-1 isoform X4 [Neocloeon triangulifer]|uniref:tight junction protein ZO-1 isoform X4 n=1 Tax=Neocloeon triangulifer TaxID=2078957 RepID=UPI00286ED7B7|nr:tight junction protein ZO-1 isoform X4 [Neocloeon triangulifer]